MDIPVIPIRVMHNNMAFVFVSFLEIHCIHCIQNKVRVMDLIVLVRMDHYQMLGFLNIIMFRIRTIQFRTTHKHNQTIWAIAIPFSGHRWL